MKRIIDFLVGVALALTVIILAASCQEDDPTYLYNYTVVNHAEFEVTLTCQGCETIILKADNERIIKTNTLFPDYEIAPTGETDLKIDYEETDTDEWTIRSYEYDLIYVVTGDNYTADITFINATGQTEQFVAIPPQEYLFREFGNDTASITASMESMSRVSVKIFYKEKLVGLDVDFKGKASASVLLTEIY